VRRLDDRTRAEPGNLLAGIVAANELTAVLNSLIRGSRAEPSVNRPWWDLGVQGDCGGLAVVTATAASFGLDLEAPAEGLAPDISPAEGG
jgi:hypothetical protein